MRKTHTKTDEQTGETLYKRIRLTDERQNNHSQKIGTEVTSEKKSIADMPDKKVKAVTLLLC